jgi:hypothetical protein
LRQDRIYWQIKLHLALIGEKISRVHGWFVADAF